MPQNSLVVDAILSRYQTWMQSIRVRNLEGILDIYAEEATYMPPGKPQFSGKQALREIWDSYLQREEFVAEYFPTIRVSDAGDMAYDIGRYRISMKKEGQPVTFEGKYVVVWRLQEAQWRVVVDIDNDNGSTM